MLNPIKYLQNKFEKKSALDDVLLGRTLMVGNISYTITDINLEYIKNFAIRTVIDRISTDISNVKPLVSSEKSKLNELIKKPNIDNIWCEFMRDLTAHYLLDKTVYVYLILNDDSTVQTMEIIPKKYVQIEYNQANGEIDKYRISTKGGVQNVIINHNDYLYDKRNTIIKISGFNSISRYNCDIPANDMESIMNQVEYLRLAAEYNRSFLQNGAKPSYALKVKSLNGYDTESLTAEDKAEAREAFKKSSSGAENAGNVLILSSNVELQQLSSDIDKLNFDELIEMAITIICMVFGIPVEIIGYSKNGGGQYKVTEDSRRSYYNNLIIPLSEFLYGKLDDAISFRYGKKVSLTYNETLIPTIMKERYETIKIASDACMFTINELRVMAKLKEIEFGEELYVSTGKNPISYVPINVVRKDNGLLGDGTDPNEKEQTNMVDTNGNE